MAAQMTLTSCFLGPEERKALAQLRARTGKRQSALIREAIHELARKVSTPAPRQREAT